MSAFATPGLRFKALLLGIVPAIVMSMIIGTYLINARLNDMETALLDRGQALARQLAAVSTYGLFSGDRSVLERSARGFLAHPDLVSVTIVSDDRSVRVQLNNPDLRDDARKQADYHLYAFEAVVRGIPARDPMQPAEDTALSPSPDTPPLGQVRVELTDRSLVGLKQEVMLTAALFIAGGILLTGLLTLVLSRRIVAPVIALSEAVNRLKEGDLSARVKPQAGDEIGLLEAGFNEMAARIALTQDELTAEVEQAVDDLQVTMDALEERNIQLDLERKKALKASQAKSDFLALMSHEIRTPMNGIIGFTRLLAKSTPRPDQEERIEAIRESASNLLAIINDVLDFAKLESGHLSFHTAPFRLRPLVNAVVALFTQQALEKGIELAGLVYDDVPDLVQGDALRIRQVLTNLLSNALKFTERGKVTVRVLLDGNHGDDLIAFSVQDDGIGIAPEVAGRLFQPFIQADGLTERRYGGTGLGLSISKRLVEGMQGSIVFTSQPGQGSTFVFSLPLQVATEPAATLPQEPAAASSASREGLEVSELCILVADDNRINLELAKALLKMHRACVVTAENGLRAVEQAAERPFDLILMDVHMPVLNGLEAARRIRDGNGPNAATPIVAITADVMAENQKRVFDAGMDETLLKPMDEQKLLEVIRGVRPAGTLEPNLEGSLEPGPEAAQTSQAPAIRDYALALKTAAGNPQLAEELFRLLLQQLQSTQPDILRYHREGEWDLLWNRVHKLLGASAGCGVPALHAVLQKLDKAVANHDSETTPQLILALSDRIRELQQLMQRDREPRP